MDRLILIRYDEIGLKGKNRPQFIKKLTDNIKRATGLSHDQIRLEWGRIYVDAGEEIDRVSQQLTYVFGIRSLSVAHCLPSDIEPIERLAVEVAKSEVEQGKRTFKIEARRSLKTFPLTSLEINARLGRTVLNECPGLGVDVHHPEFTIEIEVRSEGSFVFTKKIPGPGGLPVGIMGRVLLLLSGGIDSPVAGWMLMKRGLVVDAVYYDSFPYTGEKAKEKVVELCRILSQWRGQRIRLYVPRVTELQTELSQSAPEPLWTVLLRRFMAQIAQAIAREKGYGALATGESLGQVASQTLENLACINTAVETLVLRPLVGMDKYEIIELAKKVGTYETSILPYEDCCTVFAPSHPETRAQKEKVEQAESQLDKEKLIQSALTNMEILSITPSEIVQVPK
jgi:thiamine biosynthesis protein ThiI